ncbi:hypothetical protein ACFLS1_05730 [Verrucomicrobiota bacterium]
MSDIKFQCSNCQQTLEAPEEMAGDAVECPSCQQQLTVPSPPAPSRKEEPGVLNINPNEMASAANATAQAAAAQKAAGQTAASSKCPGCGADMKPDAVLCIKCGFNKKLGKKISTDFA